MDQLIEELRFMYELDQRTREYLDYGSFDKSFTDSIERLPQEKIKTVQKGLSLSKATREHLWEHFLSPLDSLKAERMLEIIETYGYPSETRLERFSGRKMDFAAYTILVHTPFSYRARMLPLLEREFKAGNMKNRCEYGYLLWHLNGRSDFKYMLENGYEMRTKEDGTFELVSTCE